LLVFRTITAAIPLFTSGFILIRISAAVLMGDTETNKISKSQ
jgi:hypothetical protein